MLSRDTLPHGRAGRSIYETHWADQMRGSCRKNDEKASSRHDHTCSCGPLDDNCTAKLLDCKRIVIHV